MPSPNTYHLTWVSLTSDVGYLFTAAPAKHSHCSLPWTRGISSLTTPPDLEHGVAKHFKYSCLENPMNSMKRQNDRILKEKLHRSVGAQYATGDQWRYNSRKNEGMEPKQKQYPFVDMTGDRSNVRSYKEQYCIGTWNVRSMNQCKLEVVKQEVARVNVDILGISELK